MASKAAWRLAIIGGATLLVALASTPSAAQPRVRVHVSGVTESVADFQKSVSNKFSKTMTIAPTRDDADLVIEIGNRDSSVFGGRSVSLTVHYLGISDRITRVPTGRGGGFRMTAGLAAIADETMKVVDDWLRDNRDAITGKNAKALTMPLRMAAMGDDLKSMDAATKANAAADLGRESEYAAAAAPLLVTALGAWEVVVPIGSVLRTDQRPPERERVGAIAANALVKLGAADALIAALGSARSDSARADAAMVMPQLGDQKALDALAGAAQKDSSTYVRQTAAAALGSWPNRQAVDPLIAALGDRNPNVRKAVAAALQKLTQQNFGEDAARWREWWATAKNAAP